MNPILKLVLELGPLGVFFFGNYKFGIFPATAAFMVAMVVSLAVSYAVSRKLPIMPLVTAVFVLIFGGLTLYLHNDTFIKLKPTMVNSFFAATLFGGMAYGKTLIRLPFEAALPPMTDEGWAKLNVRWAWFFVFLAILNEVVWRNFSTNAWVDFKVFALTPITLAFSLAQLRLIMQHQIPEPEVVTVDEADANETAGS
jgi:intracellular septation protein